jgi:hypothetical protein
MTKQPKEKEQDEPRRVGPKFARNVIPDSFQIRRPASPMGDLLDEAAGVGGGRARAVEREQPEQKAAPVKTTPVTITPVESPAVASPVDVKALPELEVFLDQVLPRFPPPRQAILLRLYRWCEGVEREMVVSTPRLAAKTNMDEKVCRNHLHALIAEGFLLRSADGEQIARFGGSDRNARGLLLRLSGQAISDLLA